MSVVVAHQESAIGRLTLKQGAEEASLRKTSMSVIHVPEVVDVEMLEARKKSLEQEIATTLREAGLSDVEWTLQVITGADVAETVLDQVADADAELLVIGARRRSPVGKMFLGSVTQTIILRADAPVLVVKAPAAARK
jgi:nucleotide-binding universal stress UspA family protein